MRIYLADGGSIFMVRARKFSNLITRPSRTDQQHLNRQRPTRASNTRQSIWGARKYMENIGFTSSLAFAKVRDFAYHDRHPLHYGVRTIEENLEHDAGDHAAEEDVNEAELENDTIESSIDKTSRRNGNDIYRRAVALFDFTPENSNEARLVEGEVVWISYRHGQGWLVSENLETGETGLVPEEYVQVLPENDEEWVDTN